MEDLVIKYAFTYGPLMIFFFAVGFAIYRATPVVVSLFKEVVAAMNSGTIALNNSTQALNANNSAMERHHETVSLLNNMFDDMKERMDNFSCPAMPVRRRSKVVIVAGKTRDKAA